MLLLPTWSIIHSRHWKAQIPYLARHARVSRSTGAATAARIARTRSRPTPSASSPPTPWPSWTRRAPSAPSSSGCRPACCWGVLLAAEHPERVAGAVFIAPGAPFAQHLARATTAVRRAAGVLRGLGEVQPPLLARGLPGLPRVLLRPGLHRAALDQADRGLRRLGPRDHGRDAGADLPRPRLHDARRVRAPVPPDHVSGARPPRHRRRGPAARRRRRARGADRRHARRARGLRALPARARSRCASTCCSASSSRRRRRRRAGRAAAAGRSARSTSRRRSGSATPGATSRSRGSCAGCIPTSRSTGSRSIPSPRRSRPRASRAPRQPRAGQRIAPHRVRVRRARPALLPGAGAAWTRSWSPTSWSSTTSSATSDYDLWIADEGWEIDYYLHENPEREARRVRVADRLRRLAADARRRRARGRS